MVQTYVNTELEQLLKPDILQSKTILVAEDDETNFYLLKEYLEFTKANIIWAQDGKEAVEIVRSSSSIDIIFMDIRMPEMDGFEALKKIRSFQLDVPIVAVTAYAVNGDREKALKFGFNDYISKPVSRKVLLEILMKIVI